MSDPTGGTAGTPVRDNAARTRFELEVDGHIAFADYRRGTDGIIRIPHVEAPPALRGTGAADRLMRGVVAIARAEGLRIMPICSYAQAWMRKHAEHHDIMV